MAVVLEEAGRFEGMDADHEEERKEEGRGGIVLGSCIYRTY